MVLRLKQPTSKALFESVEAVAGGGLRNLRDQCLRVAQQHVAQILIAIKLIQQRPRRSLDRAAGQL